MKTNRYANRAIAYLLNCENEKLPKETIVAFEPYEQIVRMWYKPPKIISATCSLHLEPRCWWSHRKQTGIIDTKLEDAL